jgi:hypothetical protein
VRSFISSKAIPVLARSPRNAPHAVNNITISKSKKKQDQTIQIPRGRHGPAKRGALSAAAPKGQWLPGLT